MFGMAMRGKIAIEERKSPGPWATAAGQKITMPLLSSGWETADTFEPGWDTVFRGVKFVVDYGLAHRNLESFTATGIASSSLSGPASSHALAAVVDVNGREEIFF